MGTYRVAATILSTIGPVAAKFCNDFLPTQSLATILQAVTAVIDDKLRRAIPQLNPRNPTSVQPRYDDDDNNGWYISRYGHNCIES